MLFILMPATALFGAFLGIGIDRLIEYRRKLKKFRELR